MGGAKKNANKQTLNKSSKKEMYREKNMDTSETFVYIQQLNLDEQIHQKELSKTIFTLRVFLHSYTLRFISTKT